MNPRQGVYERPQPGMLFDKPSGRPQRRGSVSVVLVEERSRDGRILVYRALEPAENVGDASLPPVDILDQAGQHPREAVNQLAPGVCGPV